MQQGIRLGSSQTVDAQPAPGGSMDLKVRDVMTGDFQSVPWHATLLEAERILLKTGLTELFVEDERGFVVGVLPDYVFLRLHLTDIEQTRADIASVMTRRFFVIGPESSLTVAARYLRDHLHHRLAVVENRRLVGILTRMAILRQVSRWERSDGAAA